MLRHTPALFAGLLLALSTASVAQNIHHVVESPDGEGLFGLDCLSLGDVDGDGLDDYAMRATTSSFAVQVFSGATGVQIGGTLGGPGFSAVATISDQNGDGRGDLAFGTSSGPAEIVIVSAFDGVEIRRVPRPSGAIRRLSARHDFDSDGVPDFVVSYVSTTLRCAVLSGLTGAPVILPLVPGADFSDALRLSSGAIRLVVGSSVFRRGPSGMPLFVGNFAGSLSSNTRVTPDLDGDGSEDIITALQGSPVPALGGVEAYSGESLDLLWRYDAPPISSGSASRAVTCVPVPDRSGDSIPDVATTVVVDAPFNPNQVLALPRVDVLSGLNGIVLEQHLSMAAGDAQDWGRSLAGLRDLTGDGLGELLVSDFNGAGFGSQRIGQVVVVASGPDPATEVGLRFCSQSQPNSTGDLGRMRAVGDGLALASSLTLQASRLPASAFGIFLVSRDFFVQDPSVSGLCLAGAIGRFSGPGQVVQSNAQGQAELSIDPSMLPTAVGFMAPSPGETWAFQLWHRDTSGGAPTFDLTDGVTIQFQ